MVDRPEGPKPGTPEYDWLYGESGGQSPDATRKRPLPKASRPTSRPAQPQEPEATRVLPQLPRPTSGAAPPPPPRRPVAPPPSPGRPRRRVRPVRWVLGLLLAWLLFLVIVPFYAMSKVSTVEAMPSGERPGDQGGTTYLVVGSDKADDLTKRQRRQLRTGPRSGTNTDTIMVLHIGSGRSVLMSIPRDTLTEVPGHGTTMINSAFSRGGPALLVQTVEGLTGIHIDHYVEMGFGSVINTVDALGGIEICPEIDMKDQDARLDIKQGCQEADGMTALGYSRSRKVTALSDLDRVARQREVMGALGDKVLSPMTFVNPVRYWRFNMAAAEAIKVSEGTGPYAMARFAQAMGSVSSGGGSCTMPNIPSPSNPNRVEPDPDRAERLFSYLIENDADSIPKQLCTPTGRPVR